MKANFVRDVVLGALATVYFFAMPHSVLAADTILMIHGMGPATNTPAEQK